MSLRFTRHLCYASAAVWSLRRVFIDARFCHQKQCRSPSRFSPCRREAPAVLLRRHSHLRFPKDQKSLTIKGTSSCFHPCWPHPGANAFSMCPPPSWGKDSRLRRPFVETSGLGSHTAWIHSLLWPLTSYVALGKLCISLSPSFSLGSGGWHNGSLIVMLRAFNKPRNTKLLEQCWIKVGYCCAGPLVVGSALALGFRIVLLLDQPLCSP